MLLLLQLNSREEVDGGASSFHQVHRVPQQHNEQTGSTTGSTGATQ